jgi:hypothetical protein
MSYKLIMMIKPVLSMWLLLYCTIAAFNQSTTCFISPCGDDSKSGLSVDSAWKSIEMVNNIFYVSGQGRVRTVYTHGSSLERVFIDILDIAELEDGPRFLNNCYFGPWLKGLPEDPQQLVADPMFVAP